jgi:hypothetical protein
MPKKKKEKTPELLEAICPKCKAVHIWNPELWTSYGEELTHCLALKSYKVDQHDNYASNKLCNTSLKKAIAALNKDKKRRKNTGTFKWASMSN